MKIILLFVALAVLSGACKEYLDVKPKGEVIPKTPEEFAALLNTHLNKIDLGTDGVLVGNATSLVDYECITDNLEASLTKYPDGNMLRTYIGDMINFSSQDYEDLYKTIRDCNLVIHEMENPESETGKKVLATAYALRGVCYLNLMRLFCEPYQQAKASDQLGLVLVEEFDMEKRVTRSNLRETALFIERDLKKAISYNQTEEIYRFTADVVKAYLARFYFWTQNWNEAIVVANEVLEKYPLIEGQNYIDMLSAKNEKKGNVLLRSFLYDFDEGGTISSRSLSARPVSRKFVDLFVEKEKDVRYTLAFDDKRVAQKEVYAKIRSAEMCLIQAEAYAHLEKSKEALHYLNLLRSKRITDHVDYTMLTLPEVDDRALVKVDAMGKPFTKLMWAIHVERQKEFFLEGDRWFELKRNGCPEFWVAKNGYKYVTELFMYTMPIPKVDMELTPGMQQNKGYENL